MQIKMISFNDSEQMKCLIHLAFDYVQHRLMDSSFFVHVLVEFFLEQLIQFVHHLMNEQVHKKHYNDRVYEFLRELE